MLPFLAAALTFVAASVASALAILLAGGGRGLDPRIAGVSLCFGLLAGFGAFIHTRRLSASAARHPADYGGCPASPWGWLVFVAFALFALRSFCWLVYEDGAHDGHPAQVEIGNVNNLGDISLHMLYARDFANGTRWWPEHPQAAGYAMRYYPGIDLFQALLLSLGVNEFNALTWVGLAGSLLALLALQRWGGSFTVAGFLFAGGLAGFAYLKTGVLVDFQTKMAWKSLPLAIFVTQRPFLFALPAGLLLMAHWREKFFAAPPTDAVSQNHRGLIPFWVELLLYAVLPAFHVFAFVFLSGALGWWFVSHALAHAPMRRHLLILVGAAFLPATGLVYLMTGHFHAGSNVTRHPGWMMDDTGLAHLWLTRHLPFFGFWLDNFGLFALLGPALWLLCAWSAARGLAVSLGDDGANRRRAWPVSDHAMTGATAFVLPAGVMFLAACVWNFAPWSWDNTKLMIWCYLAVLPFVWERFVRPYPAILRVGICTALFFSGAVTLAGGLGTPAPRPAATEGGTREPDPTLSLIETAELDSVRLTVRDLPVEARFAARPDYNHPLVYCGRKVAMGYDGHLHSQGIDYKKLARDLDTLMNGRPGWREAAARLEVRYVFWGLRELRYYTNSTLPWADPDEPVAKGDYGAVYEIRPDGGGR